VLRLVARLDREHEARWQRRSLEERHRTCSSPPPARRLSSLHAVAKGAQNGTPLQGGYLAEPSPTNTLTSASGSSWTTVDDANVQPLTPNNLAYFAERRLSLPEKILRWTAVTDFTRPQPPPSRDISAETVAQPLNDTSLPTRSPEEDRRVMAAGRIMHDRRETSRLSDRVHSGSPVLAAALVPREVRAHDAMVAARRLQQRHPARSTPTSTPSPAPLLFTQPRNMPTQMTRALSTRTPSPPADAMRRSKAAMVGRHPQAALGPALVRCGRDLNLHFTELYADPDMCAFASPAAETQQQLDKTVTAAPAQPPLVTGFAPLGEVQSRPVVLPFNSSRRRGNVAEAPELRARVLMKLNAGRQGDAGTTAKLTRVDGLDASRFTRV
jgi:hypothetical protein